MWASSGSARRSSACRPSRRRTKEPRLSSPPGTGGRGGTKRSRPSRSLPAQERRGEARNGPIRVGTTSRTPSGTGTSRPPRTTYTRRCGSLLPWIRSPRPSSRTNSSAHGLWTRKVSGPPSTTKPPGRSVTTLPPRRGDASTTVQATDSPAAAAVICASRVWAAVRPAIPPPTTTTWRVIGAAPAMGSPLFGSRGVVYFPTGRGRLRSTRGCREPAAPDAVGRLGGAVPAAGSALLAGSSQRSE